jgi:hypothetical protein
MMKKGTILADDPSLGGLSISKQKALIQISKQVSVGGDLDRYLLREQLRHGLLSECESHLPQD